MKRLMWFVGSDGASHRISPDVGCADKGLFPLLLLLLLLLLPLLLLLLLAPPFFRP